MTIWNILTITIYCITDGHLLQKALSCKLQLVTVM